MHKALVNEIAPLIKKTIKHSCSEIVNMIYTTLHHCVVSSFIC